MIKRTLSFLLTLTLLAGLISCNLPTFISGTPDTSGTNGESTSSQQEESGSKFTPTVYTTVEKTVFETRYADQLSPNEKAVYDAIAALPAGTTVVEVTLPELPKLCQGRAPTDEEMNKLSADIGAFTANALYAVWLDDPTLFWLDHSKYSYDISVESDENAVIYLASLKINLSLSAAPEVIAEQAAALDAAVKDFSPLGATVADKIAYINAYLCSRIEYDLEAPNRSSIVGALVDGKCVCEGYARAFDYLASLAGIDAVCIPGKAFTEEHPDGEGHMWNAVRLDGTLYAIDATWNDTTEKNSYLLVGTETLCDGDPFGKTHVPNMLMLEGPYKAFAFPTISPNEYAETP